MIGNQISSDMEVELKMLSVIRYMKMVLLLVTEG